MSIGRAKDLISVIKGMRNDLEETERSLSILADAAYREYYRRIGFLDKYNRYTLRSLSDDGRSLLFQYGGWMDVLPVEILWDMDSVVQQYHEQQEMQREAAQKNRPTYPAGCACKHTTSSPDMEKHNVLQHAEQVVPQRDFVLIEGC
jgi:hypothetical protein